jgi:hypothetical protein
MRKIKTILGIVFSLAIVTTSSYSAIKVPKGMTVYTPTGVYKAQ